MTSFDDLLTTYASSEQELFKQVEALSPQERHDLLVENVEGRLHANRVDEEDQVDRLPREFRRRSGVRWDHFGYVLHYFTRGMLEQQLRGHLAIEQEDAKAEYMRNMLAMLVWMSIDHSSDKAEGETEAPTRGKKVKRRG